MVFKRRDKLPFWRSVGEALLPPKGWARVFRYIGLRLRRLPDTPHKIALGIAVGVFACFTPFFGFHVATAILLALIVRANFLAAFLGTFFGNPPSFFVIATINFRIGHWLLDTGDGAHAEAQQAKSVLQLFGDAFLDLWQNFKAVFTSAPVDLTNLVDFFYGVMVPYTVGGIVPGIVTATFFYFLTKPLINAYQHRRKGRLLELIKNRRKKSENGADGKK